MPIQARVLPDVRLDHPEVAHHPTDMEPVSLGPQATIAKGGAMAQTRKLYRSRTNRKLAGVCGGLAHYFNTDATLIRALFIVLALLGGPGLLIYLLMWIIVPEEPQGAA